jgi:hypothetical protein
LTAIPLSRIINLSESVKKYYSFIETPVFVKQIADKGSIDLLIVIQSDLLENPIRGDIVKCTGGARKARIADPRDSRGKSGSYRYLYLYLEDRGRIYLLFLYGKNEQSDLSADQKKIVAGLVEQIKGVFHEDSSKKGKGKKGKGKKGHD